MRIAGEPPALSGEKRFASGAGGLDYVLVTAAIDGGDRRLVIVPADHPDRANLFEWRARAARASASGRYILDSMPLDPAMLLGAPGDYDRGPRFTAGAWRFCAVQLCRIEALVDEIRAAMSEDARQNRIQRARLPKPLWRCATRASGSRKQRANSRSPRMMPLSSRSWPAASSSKRASR
ncbi:alkylation response protein AidB-like acyl-CoA dehydrogenase [Sphingomonas zeicaulis]|uniref:hypothetical protein n=1 Tax=Sphingomonas zeicaulis TaxID=1632740 RepID=UPI003D242686